MFARLFHIYSAIVTLALPLASALTLNAPVGAATGGLVTITWQATSSDPGVFSLEMVNPIFHNTFAVANNVPTSLGSLTLVLPQLPIGDGYTIAAIDPSNVNTIYSTSGSFSVNANSTSSVGTGTTTKLAVSSGTSHTTTGTSSTSTSANSTSTNGTPTSFKLDMGPAAVVLFSAAAGAIVLF